MHRIAYTVRLFRRMVAASLVILLFACGQALATPIPVEENQGESAIGNVENAIANGERIGVVLCEALTLRAEPDNKGDFLGTLRFGAQLSIVGEDDRWYRIQCQVGQEEVTGWVRGEYVLVNPQYYVAAADTPAYAYPAPDAPRVALLAADDFFPIIAEVDGYYAISLRAASAFVEK